MKNQFVNDEIRFGDLFWKKRNLTVTEFRNGEEISLANSIEELDYYNKKKEPCCHFLDFNVEHKSIGILYNEFAIKDIRGLGEIGCRIPKDKEWMQLFRIAGYLFEDDEAHLWDSDLEYNQIRHKQNIDALKTLKDSKAWKAGNHKGNNKSGFSALPATTQGTYSEWASFTSDGNTLGSVVMGSISALRKIQVFFREHNNHRPKSEFIRLVRDASSKNKINLKLGSNVWLGGYFGKDIVFKNLQIPLIQSGAEWGKCNSENKPAYCFYDNEPFNSEPFYNWHAVKLISSELPNDHKIPSSDDYKNLFLHYLDSGNERSLLDIYHWSQYFKITKDIEHSANLNVFDLRPLGQRIAKYVTHWEGEVLYNYDSFSGKGVVARLWAIDESIVTFYFEENKLKYSSEKISNEFGDTSLGLPVKIIKIIN